MYPTLRQWPRRLLPIVALCCACAIVRADEPVGLKLLRPDSLDGWQYGEKDPQSWTISNGQLTGTAESTPLLSGWTFDDFELRFQWSAKTDGAWTLSLPDVPAGPGLQIALHEGAGCGAISDNGQSLAPGAAVEPLASAELHSAQVRRFGDTLSVIIDGKVVSEATIDRDRRFGLALAVPRGEATLADLRLREPRGNPLNNGHDQTGWFVNNDKGTWTVDNGDFIPTSHRGLHYLRPDKEYANFTLSLKYKISRGGNSGLAIRTAKNGWPSGDGMELQILDRPGLVKDSTMAVYGNVPPLDRADRSEEWNDVVVKADGRMISCWVNGELVQQVNTAGLPEVKHRHLKGWIGVQDHGGKVRFREIYIHEAPEGLGLDAWYAPHTEMGSGIVLDRLMNSERCLRRQAGLRRRQRGRSQGRPAGAGRADGPGRAGALLERRGRRPDETVFRWRKRATHPVSGRSSIRARARRVARNPSRADVPTVCQEPEDRARRATGR